MNKKKKKEKEKKVKHPVMAEKAHRNLWRGFSGPASWTPSWWIKWPDEHPHTHCEGGEYVPDAEAEICQSCGWIPSEAVYCKQCGVSLREYMEKLYMLRFFERYYGPKADLMLAAYLAYCSRYADELSGSPDLDAVADWFNGMKDEEREDLLEEFMPKSTVEISMKVIFMDSGPGGSVGTAPFRKLEDLLDRDDVPDTIKDQIRALMKTKSGVINH